MNARRAARELALLTLFQMEKQGSTVPEKTAATRQDMQDLVLASVRALTSEAQYKIKTAAEDLAEVSRTFIDMEENHPDNSRISIDEAFRPVPIPTTREMVEKIEKCLQGAEYLFEAIRIPELLAHAQSDEVQTYANRLISLVVEHQPELDEMLNRHSTEWRVDRLIKMDRYLLRVAAAEMRYVNSVDASVSINEAVELSKQYSTEESYRFINGILGSLAAELEARGLSTTAPAES